MFPTVRMRRLRQNPTLRQLLQQDIVTINDMMLPLFVKHGKNIKKPIETMPGHYQLSLDNLAAEIKQISELGIKSVILFGIPEHKDCTGSDAYSSNGILQQAIAVIKDCAPDMLVVTDICMCEYTSHGHCGIMNEYTGRLDLDNDATLEILSQQAVSHVQAGADMVAPSGMIDGMVQAIRHGLDGEGMQHIPIMSYSAKFASGFYGAFRAAAESVPEFGDRRSYQMDPNSGQQALREVAEDIQEGADIVMVKPAMAYLDIAVQIHQQHPGVPLAMYHVSSEYAMLKVAAERGLVDEQQVVFETLTAMKRAGASILINYYCKDIARWLQA